MVAGGPFGLGGGLPPAVQDVLWRLGEVYPPPALMMMPSRKYEGIKGARQKRDVLVGWGGFTPRSGGDGLGGVNPPYLLLVLVPESVTPVCPPHFPSTATGG